ERRDHAGDPIDSVGNRRREEEPASERGRRRGCKRSGGRRANDARYHADARVSHTAHCPARWRAWSWRSALASDSVSYTRICPFSTRKNEAILSLPTGCGSSQSYSSAARLPSTTRSTIRAHLVISANFTSAGKNASALWSLAVGPENSRSPANSACAARTSLVVHAAK